MSHVLEGQGGLSVEGLRQVGMAPWEEAGVHPRVWGGGVLRGRNLLMGLFLSAAVPV